MATTHGWLLTIHFKSHDLETQIEHQEQKVEESRTLVPEKQRHEKEVLRDFEMGLDPQKEKATEYTSALRTQILRIRLQYIRFYIRILRCVSGS